MTLNLKQLDTLLEQEFNKVKWSEDSKSKCIKLIHILEAQGFARVDKLSSRSERIVTLEHVESNTLIHVGKRLAGRHGWLQSYEVIKNVEAK